MKFNKLFKVLTPLVITPSAITPLVCCANNNSVKLHEETSYQLQFTKTEDQQSYLVSAATSSNPEDINEISIPGTHDGLPVSGIVDGNETTRKGVFSNFVNLDKINFPTNSEFKYIGKFAFSGIRIMVIDIPSNIQLLGMGAFYNCPELNKIKLYWNDEEIADIKNFVGKDENPHRYFAGCFANYQNQENIYANKHGVFVELPENFSDVALHNLEPDVIYKLQFDKANHKLLRGSGLAEWKWIRRGESIHSQIVIVVIGILAFSIICANTYFISRLIQKKEIKNKD